MKTLSELMTDYRAPLLEAWNTEMHTAKKDKGMFKGKSKAEIKSALSKNKKTAANDRKKGKAEPESLKKKIKQEEFALRAKNNFGKVSESIELNEGVRVGFEKILKDHHLDVDEFLGGNDLTPSLFDALYEYYFDEMPYGVAKARTGDPMQWVTDRFARDLEHEGLMDASPAPVAGPSAIGEGKTMRKCKGKGCDKKCADGKEFCSAACKKSMPMKESKFIPGPFSKNGVNAGK